MQVKAVSQHEDIPISFKQITEYNKMFLMTDTQIPKFLVTGSLNEKTNLTYHRTLLSKVYFVNMLGKDDDRITTFDNKECKCKPTAICS
jgi:hypothetical protein